MVREIPRSRVGFVRGPACLGGASDLSFFMLQSNSSRRGFTLIELLVVISIIALLIGILIPALGSARANARITVCGSRLQQIGVGMVLYSADFDNRMPQAVWSPTGEKKDAVVIGALFAGKRGQLPFYDINKLGAQGRPLNRYVVSQAFPPDSEEDTIEIEAFKSPVDKGAQNTGLPDELARTDSMYNLIGSSYTLNDHTLEGEDKATLVPRGGGRMPYVKEPTKTWTIATHTIYTYQENGDKEMYWMNKSQEFANMLFLDSHVRTKIAVPKGVVNTTPDYTFLP